MSRWRRGGFESRSEAEQALRYLKRRLREMEREAPFEYRRRERTPLRNILGPARRELARAKARRREREAKLTPREQLERARRRRERERAG